MKTWKYVLFGFLFGSLLFAFSGCGQQPEAPEPAEEEEEEIVGEEAAPVEELEGPIRIGAIFAITGPASWLGEPEANTVRMILEEVNAAGGINGREVELLIKDTQGDGTRTVNAVQELLREDVVAIIGPSRSGTSMAVTDICEEAQIPLVSCAALAQIVEGRTWIFKTPQKDSDVVERIYDYMKEKGIQKVAVITGTTGFGAGGRDKLLARAPDFGIEIVADETYGPKDTDMTPQLTKIKVKNPDALVNWSIVPAQSIMMKNMRQLGMTTQLFQSHGFGNIQYLQAAGEAAEGTIFPAGRLLVAEELPEDHIQKELLVNFKRNYEAKYNDTVSTFAGHAYDALHLVLEACEKAGATRQAIRDYIEGRQGFVGTAGVFNFSPEDHTGLDKTALEMLTVKNGQFALLEK